MIFLSSLYHEISWVLKSIPSNKHSKLENPTCGGSKSWENQKKGEIFQPRLVTRYTKELEPVQMRPKGILEAHQ